MHDETMQSEIAERWTAGSKEHDPHVSHGIHRTEEKDAWIAVLGSVLPKQPLRILDVGCGTGAMGLLLSEMGHTVTGIDLSAGMMEVGRTKNAELGLSMTFQEGDAENPPFADETFDAVINRHLLWTLPHPETALANWYRVLKPSGTLIVIDGRWDDGSLVSAMRRKLSLGIACRLEKHPHGSHEYSAELRSNLPNVGGMPQEMVEEQFRRIGLSAVRTQSLAEILAIQRKEMTWYAKIAPQSPYYLVSGTKPASAAPEE